MKTIIKIYGVQSRMGMIKATAEKLSVDEENIFLDDRDNGGDPLYTAKKAYLSDCGDATHGIFLQDDVEVCDNFIEICEQIIAAHPNKIIGLFPFDYMRYDSKLDSLESPYLEIRVLSGQGIIMPIEYIKPCFEWLKSTYDDKIDDDKGIHQWAKYSGVKVITTVPALVQHIGDVSAIDTSRKVRRTYYYSKNPVANWSNPIINKGLFRTDKFAPKHKILNKTRRE